MAACELRGELKYRDGTTKEFVVTSENNLKSILFGLQKLSAEVSTVLSDLVLQEKGLNSGADSNASEDEDEEDSDEEEEESQPKSKGSTVEPPPKRPKTLQA
ncbi:uncharacterized protein LOC136716871 [Amia ocellicauda]|uniref:uncharacterized protein LOC136716871 n=1 Tax=Amia ocellicauda TaxID=2972642 RepID=UPI003464AFC3